MEIVRPLAFGSVIVAGLLLLGCDVKFQRNSEHLHYLPSPVQPNSPVSPGEKNRKYEFEIAQLNDSGILLPSAEGEEADEHVGMNLQVLSDDRWGLNIFRASRFPEDDLRHDDNPTVIRFSQRDVIPYYGDLFRITIDSDQVRMEQCTELLPSEMVPAAGSRVITMDGSEATFFRKRLHRPDGVIIPEDPFETIELVKFETDPESTRALILRKRMIVHIVNGTPETKLIEPPKREWVGAGANLLVDDQLVRVKQIVQPDEISGVGTPVGWIELEQVDLSQVERHRALL
ncbi:hypothetical protein Pan97_52750 [Bremerella volcania]|uniref:Lipoprotein n=1 Tax=Bremerella volcania TaxID=2527984 RepID=A0A518CG29_9BACT|nr:hypothetical protein [Bremerella volcania]QDU78192.1 hypothetical protein Pan97_52750 [Bremerella volcania]